MSTPAGGATRSATNPVAVYDARYRTVKEKRVLKAQLAPMIVSWISDVPSVIVMRA